MSNLRALERRVEELERQVTGHHRHGTLAKRLATLEETIKGDPMRKSSIAERLDEIEARARGESIPERIDDVLGADRTTADTVADRVATIESRLDSLEDGMEGGDDPTALEPLLDRIEARLLALERARKEDD